MTEGVQKASARPAHWAVPKQAPAPCVATARRASRARRRPCRPAPRHRRGRWRERPSHHRPPLAAQGPCCAILARGSSTSLLCSPIRCRAAANSGPSEPGLRSSRALQHRLGTLTPRRELEDRDLDPRRDKLHRLTRDHPKRHRSRATSARALACRQRPNPCRAEAVNGLDRLRPPTLPTGHHPYHPNGASLASAS